MPGSYLWTALRFFPVGWPQLDAVFEHGLAYARSLEFYDTTVLWQWLRIVGDVPFAVAALLMAFDFIVKLAPLFPNLAARYADRRAVRPASWPASKWVRPELRDDSWTMRRSRVRFTSSPWFCGSAASDLSLPCCCRRSGVTKLPRGGWPVSPESGGAFSCK